MKRHFLFLLLVFGVLGLKAQTFTYGDLNYEVNYGGTSVTVLDHVDGTDATGTLTIPDHVVYNGNSYAVTIIDSYAFSYCRGLEGTLVLPNTLEEIGDDAFDYCGFTGVVTIPALVEWIGYTPFYGCDGIEGFVVDPANEDYDSRDNCNAVISSYNNELKFGCKNSTIPNGVESIAEDAFSHIGGLTSITIPGTVTEIGGWSFWFTGLTIITIPNTVTYIGTNPFGGCAELEEIVVEDGNPVFDSRNGCNAIIRTSTNELLAGCQNTVIPDDVTRIGDNAFYYCSTLTGELVIPEQITSIGEYAFEKCTGLTGSLVIPNTVVELGESAFGNCSGFDGTLTLSENLTYIGGWTFEECAGFTGSLVIPDLVTEIGSSAFEGCHGFDGKLTLPKGLNYVGSFAFASCSGFTEAVVWAETPPTLDMYPFGGFGCTTLMVPCGCVSVYEYSDWSEQFTNIVEDCTAVTENGDNGMSVYPNPTQSTVRIEAKGITNLCIFNLLGEKVFESLVSGDAFEFDFSGYNSGVYLIRMETAKGVETKLVTVE